MIEERRDRIADDLDQAVQLKEKTDAAIAAYEAALADARAKAHAIAQETRDKLHAETEKRRRELDAKLAERIAEAETRINATKEAALRSVRDVAVDVTGSVIAHLLNEEADTAAIQRAVDAELS